VFKKCLISVLNIKLRFNVLKRLKHKSLYSAYLSEHGLRVRQPIGRKISRQHIPKEIEDERDWY
jgi:hypothetical protein